MRRRWARAGLVACLILCFAGLHGFAPSVSWKHTHHRQKAAEYRTSAKESAADVVTIHPHRCKLKRIDLCSYFTPTEKNESLVEDDKRLVPTGPNPLHNSNPIAQQLSLEDSEELLLQPTQHIIGEQYKV